MRRNAVRLSVFIWALAHLLAALAEPVITSPPPSSGGSPSAALVFTFSEAMDPDLTGVDFYDLSTFALLPTIPSWSGGNTILTCTPSPAFPANRQIVWSAYGENPAGDPLGGTPGGLFTTGSGSGNGGNGTNAITTFSIGKVHHYNQASAGAPTLDPSTPYDFSAVTSLSSNRTATNVVLTLPTAAVSNLVQLDSARFILYGADANLAAYEAAYPAGNYSFQVKAVSSNQTVVVNLPITNLLAQPPAPHVNNFPAAQAVDPTQPFVLSWDAFAGGTAADYIDVDVGTNYGSANPATPGALSGTARTLTIPAGTLLPNATYLSRIGFFHWVGGTNAEYATNAFRATYTEFPLTTIASGQLVLTNAAWTPAAFSFDVLCTNNQVVTVEYTNVLTAPSWTKLLTATNISGTHIHVVSTQSVSHSSLFYRARNGP